MTDMNVDASGLGGLVSDLDELADRFEDEPIYVVGSSVEYSVFLEFGTSQMPPYPWLRPAVRELRRDPEAFIEENTQTSVDEIDSSTELVKALAFALERQAKQNAAAAKSADRSPGTHPEHPQVDTGTLRATIRAQRIQ